MVGVTFSTVVEKSDVIETVLESPTEIPAVSVEPENGLSNYWGTNITQWSDIIIEYSNKFSIDPDMVAAVMTIESKGNPDALSHAGAIGLLQIMPIYHSCASWNPRENVACGTQILSYYQTRAGDWRKGLAAYNAGETGRDLYWRGYDYADLVLIQYNNSKEY